MAVQAGGYSVGIEYVVRNGHPPTLPSNEGRSGPWGAILSFFGVRKAAPAHKRPPSVELQPGPDKPPRHEQAETVVVKAAPIPETKPTKPFPFLDLPFELLCEVIARVPAGERHFFRSDSPLATTCKAFYDAINTVSTMVQHREADAVSRRVSAMQRSSQIVPMIDSLVDASPSIRDWALAAIVRLTGSMSATGRQQIVKVVLERAKNQSSLWQLELMRQLARWLPDTDSELLSLLTDRTLKLDARNADEDLAKSRALAQLAHRISPNDLPATIHRWESIYQYVLANRRNVDILTVLGLQASFDHLSFTFRCTFTVASTGMLLCSLLDLYRQCNGPQTEKFMAACTEEELERRPAPKPLPGTVKPHDPLRAYSSIMARPIPKIERLPSHIV